MEEVLLEVRSYTQWCLTHASDARDKIGTLKRADGSFTKTGQETLKVLLETHFPDSKEVDSCT